MSLHSSNEDNAGEGTASRNSALLLTPGESTARASILRMSQKENLPPRGIVKPMKVTFQTPVRDPQTGRIFSPDRKKKSESSLVTEVTDNFLLSLPCTAVRSQSTMIPEMTSGKEEVPTGGKGLIPDLSDDLDFLSAVHRVEPLQRPGGLLNLSNGQELSFLGDFTGDEEQDGPALSRGLLSLPQSVPENTPSEEAGGRTKDRRSLLDSSLHDDVFSEQIVSCDCALSFVSERTCDPDLQNPPLQPVQKFGSFENLNDEIKNADKETSAEARGTWAAPFPDCMVFDSDTPAPGPPAPASEESGVPKYEADTVQTLEPKAADPFEAVDFTPSSLKEIEDPVLAKRQTVAENDGGREPSHEDESTFSEASDPDHLPLSGQLPRALCGRREPAGESNPPFTEDEFRPAIEIFGSLDYLEQFGVGSLKESDLRKQSLFLRFDPLLKNSPKKGGPEPGQAAFPVAPLLPAGVPPRQPARPEAKAPEQEGLLVELDFLVSTELAEPTAPVGIPASHRVPPFSCARPSEAQSRGEEELEEALEQLELERERVQDLTAQVQEKEEEALEWRTRHDNMYAENKEMGKIVLEFEDIIEHVIGDNQLTKKELQKALGEKQQAVSELDTLEKSFSEFFNRFTKQKEAMEGFVKNEETLKKCVEDYAERIRKEEQRYQALKAHAEEKLDQANEEIAQVRSKAASEVAALNAILRKEQLRVQLLESSIEQKIKENKELTKICEDLISKMEKLG
ncbi:transforming acidic coiled-coil-containing protein 3 isoform X3 [Erythrolamprus reginae]|uniref:transforming acidic coiled-coil-containing protein 3 isoform X3 n=1 Tax=Erythrolamprus reginae TaxID=121349 RepID=UPI00396C43F3